MLPRFSGSSTCIRRYETDLGADNGDETGRKLTVQQESFTKLGFHLILFFFYLYSMIVALIKDEAH